MNPDTTPHGTDSAERRASIWRDALLDAAAAQRGLFDLHCSAKRSMSSTAVGAAYVSRSGSSDVHDSGLLPLGSGHARIEGEGLRRRRDESFRSLGTLILDELGLHEGATELIVRFRLTDALSPAIDVSIDGVSAHPRPVTPRTLAPILAELEACLSVGPSTPREERLARSWRVGTDRITACSPDRALWLWMCLRHRELVRHIISEGAAAADEEIRKTISRTVLHERFSAADSLDRILARAAS